MDALEMIKREPFYDILKETIGQYYKEVLNDTIAFTESKQPNTTTLFFYLVPSFLAARRMTKEMRRFLYTEYNIRGSILDVPVIWTLHDCWAFTGHCAYYDFTHCDKWIAQGCNGRCPERNLYPCVWGISQNKRNYAQKEKVFSSVNRMTLVTPSKWLKTEVEKSFLKKYDTVVIPNGVDQNVFKVTESDLRVRFGLENKKVVLSVANYWNKYKGLDDLVSLASMLGEQYRIVMIGVDKKLQQSLPATIIGIEKTKNIHELAQWYSCADIFVNPTYVDNFPTTNIEALSCGTPVITYRTGGSIEAADSHTGMIIQQGDVEELRNAIYTMCSCEKPISACLHRAKLFNKDKCFQEYIQLYESLI